MLYHSQLGIPESARTSFGAFLLEYSQHAMQAAQNDRYGVASLPKFLDTTSPECQVIEVETDDTGKTTKVVYRIPYDGEKDLVLAVIPARRFVKTVWFNERGDLHNTLDESKYDRVN